MTDDIGERKMIETFKPGDRVQCVRDDVWHGRTVVVGDILVFLQPLGSYFFRDSIGGVWCNDSFKLLPPIDQDHGGIAPGHTDLMVSPEAIDEVLAASPEHSDPISYPDHYARHVIEPITFINANKLSFNLGNVVEYVTRADAKGGVEDLLKARRYLDIEIEALSRHERVARGEDAAVVWGPAL